MDVLIKLGASLDIPKSTLSFQKGQVDIFIGPADPVLCLLAHVNGTCVIEPGVSKFVSLSCPVLMEDALFLLSSEWDSFRSSCGLVCLDSPQWDVSVENRKVNRIKVRHGEVLGSLERGSSGNTPYPLAAEQEED